MAYAVIALFDDELSCHIRDTWLALEKNNLSTYAKKVANRQPHLTLASYNVLTDLDYFVQRLSSFCEKQATIPIQLTTLGSFLGSQALFLTPTMTQSLFECHSRYYQELGEFSDDSASLYLPDRWIPHVTLANYLSDNKLAQAFSYCQKEVQDFKGEIAALSLIAIHEESVEELLRLPLKKLVQK